MADLEISEFILTESEYSSIKEALKPFLLPIFIACGFITTDISIASAGFFTDPGELAYWFPLEYTYPYQKCTIEYTDPIVSDNLTIIGNYQTDTISKLTMEDHEQDHLSDILGSVWKYMKELDPASARISLQAFLLLKRIYTDSIPMTTDNPSERSIAAYGI